MDGDPMIDDEVGAHTRVTVLAYWKFESVSLQRRVRSEPRPATISAAQARQGRQVHGAAGTSSAFRCLPTHRSEAKMTEGNSDTADSSGMAIDPLSADRGYYRVGAATRRLVAVSN